MDLWSYGRVEVFVRDYPVSIQIQHRVDLFKLLFAHSESPMVEVELKLVFGYPSKPSCHPVNFKFGLFVNIPERLFDSGPLESNFVYNLLFEFFSAVLHPLKYHLVLSLLLLQCFFVDGLKGRVQG